MAGPESVDELGVAVSSERDGGAAVAGHQDQVNELPAVHVVGRPLEAPDFDVEIVSGELPRRLVVQRAAVAIVCAAIAAIVTGVGWILSLTLLVVAVIASTRLPLIEELVPRSSLQMSGGMVTHSPVLGHPRQFPVSAVASIGLSRMSIAPTSGRFAFLARQPFSLLVPRPESIVIRDASGAALLQLATRRWPAGAVHLIAEAVGVPVEGINRR